MGMAFNAVITSTRCAGLMILPDPRARRVTVASSTRIESGKATGASVCDVKIMSHLCTQPVGEMFAPISGPTVRVVCQSPQ